MKLNDLKLFICNKVLIYTTHFDGDDVIFDYIYEGILQNAPENILNMFIRTISAKQKGIILICVREN